jgi:hypothetical protein
VCVCASVRVCHCVCVSIGPTLTLRKEDVTSVSEALDVFNEMLGPFGAVAHFPLSHIITLHLLYATESRAF